MLFRSAGAAAGRPNPVAGAAAGRPNPLNPVDAGAVERIWKKWIDNHEDGQIGRENHSTVQQIHRDEGIERKQ